VIAASRYCVRDWLLRHLRNMVEHDPEAGIGNALYNLAVGYEYAVVRDVLVVERGQHHDRGDAERDRVPRQLDGFGERGDARPRRQMLRRDSACNDAIQQCSALGDRERVGFPGGAPGNLLCRSILPAARLRSRPDRRGGKVSVSRHEQPLRTARVPRADAGVALGLCHDLVGRIDLHQCLTVALAIASLVVRDFYVPYWNPTEATELKVTRLLSVLIGVLPLIFAFFVPALLKLSFFTRAPRLSITLVAMFAFYLPLFGSNRGATAGLIGASVLTTVW
jgi:hypothetical protein